MTRRGLKPNSKVNGKTIGLYWAEGAPLREFKERSRLTLSEISEVTGYDPANLSRWMRGVMKPSRTMRMYFYTLTEIVKEGFDPRDFMVTFKPNQLELEGE